MAATLLGAALAASGCQARGDANQEASPATAFGPPGPGPGGGWLLLEGAGPAGEIPQVEGHRSTLVIEDGEVGGHASCNGFGGGRIDGERIRFAEFATTLMGCEGELLASEEAYYSAVQDVATIRREGDRLVLTGPSSALIFEYLAPPDLYRATGRTLHLARIRHADESTGVVRSATLRLDRGSIEGSTGCRSFAGTYVERGDELVITRLSLEGDADECGPREVDQEAVVLDVLGDRFHTRVENGTQLIVTAQGGDSLEYG